MAVRLFIGRAGTGKTTYCMNEIVEELKERPEGDPIIYIVPDQMTFSIEYKFISIPHLGGMIRTQVYSFSRLAWKILQETGGMSRYHLNSVGINMLIKKIVEMKKGELKLYGKAADKNGFIEQMEQILTEFKRYCVSPEELLAKEESIKEEDANKKILRDKLHDLELIYRSFEETLFDKYIDSEDYLKLLAEKIRESSFLKNAHVYIDGFHSLTPQEYGIIEQLIKYCKKVTICLTLDTPFKDESPDELHLFRMTGETCQTIYEIAKVAGVPIEEKIFHQPLKWKDDSFKHLEAFFAHRPAIVFQQTPAVTIAEAQNRRSEIEGVARTIIKLAKEEGYRYKDMAILVRNGEQYADTIGTIFYDYEIPYFIDRKKTMLNHPLVEFVRSTLEIINGYWRYEPIFRAVKTELLFPIEKSAMLREKMDILENYVLAYGIQGNQWTNNERWKYHRFKGLEIEDFVQTDKDKEMENEINKLKEIIVSPLLKLSRRLKKAENGRQLCESLYLFLEELNIPSKLEKWKIIEEEKGNLMKARQHDQVWNGIVNVLDQFVEIFGDEKMSLKQFATILDAGLQSLRFSLVPPAIDQVIVADLEKSRLIDVKIAFVIGLNEGVLPAKISEEGLLATNERETLLSLGIRLAPSSKMKLLDEEFIAYQAFTTPSERLFVTYPLADEEGKALLPSSYINRLEQIFPEMEKVQYVTEPSELKEEEQLDYIVDENTCLAYLSMQLSLKKRNYVIYDLWWDVYNYYVNHPFLREKAKKVLSSLHYTNEAKPLSKEMTEQLYGTEIQTSVSRIEMFSSCPFSHFAQYGLKLKERSVFRLEPPGIGELFHGALKYIVETVLAKERTLADTTKEEMEQLAKEAVEVLAPKLIHEILHSSNRYLYIKKKLQQIIVRAANILREHAKVSGFVPVGLEVSFGRKKKIPPLKFTLKNGVKMELVGRIDRVDMAKQDDQIFLRVIDYKSSETDIDLNEVYYGLAMQMITYLDIVMMNAPLLIQSEADPAGVLYFHVHNPIIHTKKELSVDELEEELLKKFKMKGLVLGNKDVIQMMDSTLDSGESTIISAGIKKDGTLTKRSKVASKEEFHLLRRYVRKVYEKFGNDMMEGIVHISPYQLKDKTPCHFCPYKSVCQFEQSMGGNEYRKLFVQQRDDILEKMRKEAGV